MPLRDAALLALVVGLLPIAFLRPRIGILAWYWLGLMSPHRLAWDFARDLELAQLIAAATLCGLVVTRDRRRPPALAEFYLLVAFWAHTAVTTFLAWYPEDAWRDFVQFTKIVLMTSVTVVLFQDRRWVRYLLLVAALSVAFYGVKGSLWALSTGGVYGLLQGPADAFLGDNNGLALGLNMALPFLFFLSREESSRWLSWTLRATFALCVVALPFTYSRAGFLGLATVLLVLLFRAQRRYLTLPLAAVALILLAHYLPERWYDRIATIANYQSDGSALSRLTAWRISWSLALDHPLIGGGFRVVPQEQVWSLYAPEWTGTVYNAHSIYFQLLAEHGFLGFGLYVLLLLSAFRSLRRLRRDARRLENTTWLVNYSLAVETSLYAYAVTGAFYNLTYFDFVYLLVAVTIVLRRLAADLARPPATDPSPVRLPASHLRVHPSKHGAVEIRLPSPTRSPIVHSSATSQRTFHPMPIRSSVTRCPAFDAGVP